MTDNSPVQRHPQLLRQLPAHPWAGFWIVDLGAVMNIVGFFLTALGTYLTIKGNRSIKHGKALVASARRNILTQVAASEISTFRNQIAILRVYVGTRNWIVAQHISGELAAKLHESKTAFVEIRDINRDRLEVAARQASAINEYLTTTADEENLKVQKLQAGYDDLGALLADVYGSLKLKESEVVV